MKVGLHVYERKYMQMLFNIETFDHRASVGKLLH